MTNRPAGPPPSPRPLVSYPLVDPTVSSSVDTDLRPEGRRALREASTLFAVLRQVGRALEAQALLKGAVSGPSLGERFASMVETVIWERGLDVDSLQASAS